MQVHRFRDCAGLWAGTGETVYLTPSEARRAAKALLAVARSIDREPFSESKGLTVGDIETFAQYPHCLTGRGQLRADRAKRAAQAM